MSLLFNYKHLYYFWVVGKEGGVARAANRLGMAVQTVSAQVKELEKSLGYTLLKPAGRGLTLTEAGLVVMAQAEAIFLLGDQLPEKLRNTQHGDSIRLRMGTSDGLPKLMVQRLLAPVLPDTALRLQFDEGEFEDLLADLALHRLDVVLADRPAPPNPNLKLYSHRLGGSELAWFGTARLAAKVDVFPQALEVLPVLLPTAHSAVRQRLEQWFDSQQLQPNIVGEFEDSALLKTFGASGIGVFPAPVLMSDELIDRYGLQQLGLCTGVEEHFYAISADKKVRHPLVQKLIDSHWPAAL